MLPPWQIVSPSASATAPQTIPPQSPTHKIRRPRTAPSQLLEKIPALEIPGAPPPLLLAPIRIPSGSTAQFAAPAKLTPAVSREKPAENLPASHAPLPSPSLP